MALKWRCPAWPFSRGGEHTAIEFQQTTAAARMLKARPTTAQPPLRVRHRPSRGRIRIRARNTAFPHISSAPQSNGGVAVAEIAGQESLLLLPLATIGCSSHHSLFFSPSLSLPLLRLQLRPILPIHLSATSPPASQLLVPPASPALPALPAKHSPLHPLPIDLSLPCPKLSGRRSQHWRGQSHCSAR